MGTPAEVDIPLSQILAPLDGTPEATIAVPYALALAGPGGAIELLTVVRDAADSAAAEAALATQAEALRGKGATVNTRVLVGDPAGHIIEAAANGGAAMIAMASRGRGAINRLIHGDVADVVSREATVPVLVVRTGEAVPEPVKIDRLVLTGSLRRDSVEVSNYAAKSKTDVDKTTWRVGANYVTEIGVAPYISYATSFQPIAGQTFGGTAFKPTEGKQVEGGVKYDSGALIDGVKLFATAAVFQIEQSNVLTTDPANINFQVQTGQVKSKGYELEAVTRIRDNLSINAAYSYTDAKITRTNIPLELGARLAAQPKRKASLFVDYTLPEGALAGLGGGVGVRYLSSSPGNIPSAFTPLVYTSPSTTLVDATAHYDMADWRFAVNASNLFDKRFAGRCNGPVGCFFGQERQVVATVTRKF